MTSRDGGISYILLSPLMKCPTTAGSQSVIRDEIKSALNSWNISYHSVQNLLLLRFLSRSHKD